MAKWKRRKPVAPKQPAAPKAEAPKTYTVEIAESAIRALAKLDKPIAARIAKTIDKLKTNPRPSGVKHLQDAPAGTLRIRVGDYRVVYVVEDARLVVLVVKVGHRRDVYRW